MLHLADTNFQQNLLGEWNCFEMNEKANSKELHFESKWLWSDKTWTEYSGTDVNWLTTIC